jgi:hypothetical protein
MVLAGKAYHRLLSGPHKGVLTTVSKFLLTTHLTRRVAPSSQPIFRTGYRIGFLGIIMIEALSRP